MRLEPRNNLRIVFLVFAAVILLAVSAVMAADAPKWVGAFFVKGKVGLKWKPADGAASYNIYRKAEGDFEKISSTEKTQYFDTEAIPGIANTYKIAAVGEDGAEVLSGEKTVNVPAGATGEFKAPEWVGLRFDRDKTFLNWVKVPGAIAYNVYRTETSGEGYEVVGNVTRTKYADSDVSKGSVFYYVISALNEEFEESEMSEEREIKCGVSAAELQALADEANKIELEDLKFTLQLEIKKDAAGDKVLNQPMDVAVNSVGNIYVSDATNGRVVVFDPTGKLLFEFGEATKNKEDPAEGALMVAGALAIDAEDNIWVSDPTAGTVQKFTADGKFLLRLEVNVAEGETKFRSNGIAILKDGRLIVTDLRNAHLYYFDADGKFLKSVGQHGSEGGEFTHPMQVAVTEDGNICLIDGTNYRIQILDAEGKFIKMFGQIGRMTGQFGRPSGIAVGLGKIWVTDVMGHTLQGFNFEGEPKYAVNGFPDYEIRLMSPYGVFVKGDQLYLVNRLAHAIYVFKVS